MPGRIIGVGDPHGKILRDISYLLLIEKAGDIIINVRPGKSRRCERKNRKRKNSFFRVHRGKLTEVKCVEEGEKRS